MIVDFYDQYEVRTEQEEMNFITIEVTVIFSIKKIVFSINRGCTF